MLGGWAEGGRGAVRRALSAPTCRRSNAPLRPPPFIPRLVRSACYGLSMRYLLLAVIVSTCACSSCVSGQAVRDQGTVIAGCLPSAVVQILACSSRHDHACVLLAVTTLVACVATSQPPAPANPPQQPPTDAAASREQHPSANHPRHYAGTMRPGVHVGPTPGAELHGSSSAEVDDLSPADVDLLIHVATANSHAASVPYAAPEMNCASSSWQSNARL